MIIQSPSRTVIIISLISLTAVAIIARIYWIRKRSKPWKVEENSTSEFMVLADNTAVYVRENIPEVIPKGTVVFIHGIFDNAEFWQPFEKKLAACGFRTLSVDLPGFGRSQGYTDEKYGYTRFATTISAVLQQKIDSPALFVGHSMGGGVAQIIAAQAPHLVGGLFLIAPVVAISGAVKALAPTKIIETWVAQFVGRAILYFVTPFTVKFFRLPFPFVRSSSVNGWDWQTRPDSIARNFSTPSGINSALACVGAITSEPALTALAESTLIYSGPVTIFGGTWDRVVPARLWREYVKVRQGALLPARLVLFDKVGHEFLDEKPAEILQEIQGFFERRSESVKL